MSRPRQTKLGGFFTKAPNTPQKSPPSPALVEKTDLNQTPSEAIVITIDPAPKTPAFEGKLPVAPPLSPEVNKWPIASQSPKPPPRTPSIAAPRKTARPTALKAKAKAVKPGQLTLNQLLRRVTKTEYLEAHKADSAYPIISNNNYGFATHVEITRDPVLKPPPSSGLMAGQTPTREVTAQSKLSRLARTPVKCASPRPASRETAARTEQDMQEEVDNLDTSLIVTGPRDRHRTKRRLIEKLRSAAPQVLSESSDSADSTTETTPEPEPPRGLGRRLVRRSTPHSPANPNNIFWSDRTQKPPTKRTVQSDSSEPSDESDALDEHGLANFIDDSPLGHRAGDSADSGDNAADVGLVALPAEFSLSSLNDGINSFKVVIQYFVHLLLGEGSLQGMEEDISPPIWEQSPKCSPIP
ncbi:hypothetical protein BJ085DRAFT_31006 [Dimargaris cristalligena]|uniref:Uncharacterized protein n=1 Tax=Dimargaris cristalligena TaxID=215637 RepID=A0A4Q0A136_9FUNG|nr:hypothetical protein BJ085DRAFT_31006 [Dimargaris cristalligena]|eukprot:RKP39458.1 hypothetical protein BJ085DRAFT_31006 [Dimargaris cristalligena]